MNKFTMPNTEDPSEEDVDAFHAFAEGLDWFSDYDAGVSICTPEETLRAGPGDTIIREGDTVRVERGGKDPLCREAP